MLCAHLHAHREAGRVPRAPSQHPDLPCAGCLHPPACAACSPCRCPPRAVTAIPRWLRAVQGCAGLFVRGRGALGGGTPCLHPPQLGRSRGVSPKRLCCQPRASPLRSVLMGSVQGISGDGAVSTGGRRALGARAAPGASRCSGTSSALEGGTGHGLGGGSAWRGSGLCCWREGCGGSETLPRPLNAGGAAPLQPADNAGPQTPFPCNEGGFLP